MERPPLADRDYPSPDLPLHPVSGSHSSGQTRLNKQVVLNLGSYVKQSEGQGSFPLYSVVHAYCRTSEMSMKGFQH